MTQQYLLGQFSALLGDLERTAAEWQMTVHDLRREVESSQPAKLPRLADEVMEVTDAICWAALARGDIMRFVNCSKSAAELAEFIDSAGLSS